jgi:hypothetical protein
MVDGFPGVRLQGIGHCYMDLFAPVHYVDDTAQVAWLLLYYCA